MSSLWKVTNKKLQRLSLATLAGILLWLAWPPLPFTPIIFVAFVPILWLEDQMLQEQSATNAQVWGYGYLTFLLWNALTTYWVHEATLAGAIFAILANALLMTIPFLLFHLMKKTLVPSIAYIGLVVFWIGLEFLHLNWQMAWPWLNLGNVFSKFPNWVQWYEYTGALGGTLWIWLFNINLFLLIKNWTKGPPSIYNLLPKLGLVLAVLFIPFLIAFNITIPSSSKTLNTVVVQPNVDPYSEKFDKDKIDQQINQLIALSEEQITAKTDLVIWPETAIPKQVNEDNLKGSEILAPVQEFLQSNPKLHLITGINSYQLYDTKATPTARALSKSNKYYDVFNTALFMQAEGPYKTYHKSILVPGVEKMPYPSVFGFLEKIAIDLGGTSGSLGAQEEPSLFKLEKDLSIAPVICYESVFGDYVGDFTKKGADLIAVITNDGWWGHTSGYKQHYLYATLRAIETRKSIARAANTGVSCFITPNGKIHKATQFWVKDVRSFNLPIIKESTFYERHGDYLGQIAAYLTVFLLLVLLVVSIFPKTYWPKT